MSTIDRAVTPAAAPRSHAGAASTAPWKGERQADAAAEQAAPRRRTSEPAPPDKCKVLLVEDEITSANALRVLLTMHGCEVQTARTLEQGLDLLHTHPTIIIADLMLPDGDGIELLARVREANLPIRVAITTAVTDPARLAMVSRLKPDAVLRKPLDVGELLRTIGLS